VVRVLSERDTELKSDHYELLLEANLNANDLEAAVNIIIIMTESGVSFDEASIHALYTYLKKSEERPLHVFRILQDLESAGRKIPTAAINVCMQASVSLLRLEEAIDMYKALHTISPAGPNTQTFNILFQGCHKAGRKELAMFLATEMNKLGLNPNDLTYDRLVLVCCNAHDFQDAFLYYEEMRSHRCIPRRGMFERLIEEGLAKGDARTPEILRDMMSCGYVPSRHTQLSVNEVFPYALDALKTPETVYAATGSAALTPTSPRQDTSRYLSSPQPEQQQDSPGTLLSGSPDHGSMHDQQDQANVSSRSLQGGGGRHPQQPSGVIRKVVAKR
jgi:pentatricopeptide repeat protein